MSERYICDNRRCGWVGNAEEALTAPDPFNPGETLLACPKCRDQSLLLACDEPGCNRRASCGTPIVTGYRTTCGEHQPKESKS